MTGEEIAAVHARIEVGHNRRDAAAIAANCAEDCVVESPIAGVHVGRLEVERVLRAVFSAFPDLRFYRDELLIFGDRAFGGIQ
jgi:hypothetical protein